MDHLFFVMSLNHLDHLVCPISHELPVDPVVAEDGPSELLPPSILIIQSADDLHAVLAQPRGGASRATASKRWTTVQALKAAVDEGATLNEGEVRTARNALYFFCAEVQNLPMNG